MLCSTEETKWIKEESFTQLLLSVTSSCILSAHFSFSSISCLHPSILLLSNPRYLFGTTVSCTRSGEGPIRRCACSCPTWRGRTPPSVLCQQSRPRKWPMRPSYECRGIFKIASTETQKKNLIILMNFCTWHGPFWGERATSSLRFLLLKHLIWTTT